MEAARPVRGWRRPVGWVLVSAGVAMLGYVGPRTPVLEGVGDAALASGFGHVLTPLPDDPDGGLEPEQRAGQRLITLVTCSELFHTDDRLVAFGHLVESETR